jgi:hypothetical protein
MKGREPFSGKGHLKKSKRILALILFII